jgi:8-oxo-dGTP pyrophosphatase MutT (NUDIX family)
MDRQFPLAVLLYRFETLLLCEEKVVMRREFLEETGFEIDIIKKLEL